MIPAALAAQDSTSSPIQLELTAQKQVQTQDATGQVKTELVAVDKVLPGETIVYTITTAIPVISRQAMLSSVIRSPRK